MTASAQYHPTHFGKQSSLSEAQQPPGAFAQARLLSQARGPCALALDQSANRAS